MSHNYDKRKQEIAALETTVSKAQAALTKLDEEYMGLNHQETKLVALLNKTQKEEACLRQALLEASESGAERRLREMRQRDQAAVAKLESALFESDSSSTSSDDDDETSKNADAQDGATQTASV
jgi:multidrug resistance efflux pump